ncbi:MAG: hypothetical protein ACP5N1_06985 [Candidatus Woesearchaeota archaeon]
MLNWLNTYFKKYNLNKLRSKYFNAAKLKDKLLNDVTTLGNTIVDSANHLTYNSSGLVGIYSDMIVAKKNIYDDFTKIRDDARTLENIIIKKNNSTNNSATKKNHSINTSSTYAETDSNMTYTNNLSPDTLSKIIELKNRYFWKRYDEFPKLIKDTYGKNIISIDTLLKDAMQLKVTDKNYYTISQINYDSYIAPKKMKEDIINKYLFSNDTLKDISYSLEKTYGMHIAVSTISVNARKYLSSIGMDFKKRKEAKKYFIDRNIDSILLNHQVIC